MTGAIIGIVLHVAHDLLGMRPHGGLKRLNRFAEDMTHANIRRGRAGTASGNSLVDRVGLASITEAGF